MHYCLSNLARALLTGAAVTLALAACATPSNLFDGGERDGGPRLDSAVSMDGGSDASRPDTFSTDAPADVVVQVRHPAARCTGSADEVPIPDGTGGHVCTRVGADRTAATGDWADVTGHMGPFLYVSPGAAAGGDGTMLRPFASIEAARSAMSGPSTIVLAAGRYQLASTLLVNGAVSFIGAGAGGAPAAHGGDAGADASDDAFGIGGGGGGGVPVGTTLVAGFSGPAIRVAGSGGNATFSRIQIVAEMPGTGTGISVEDGALVTLHDVDIRDVSAGIEVSTTAALRASGLSVGPVDRIGISLRQGSSGDINGFMVHDCGDIGILAHSSAISLREGALTENLGGGAVLVGVSPAGTDSIDRVVARGNRVVGIGAAALSGAAGISRHIEFTLISVTGTAAGAVGPGGYGAFIGHGIDAHLDRLISSDLRRGHGSEFLTNARAGILVSGDDATLELHGARADSNFGPGLMIQNRASAPRVAYSEFKDNRGVGVMITSEAVLAYFLCNESSQNVRAPITFTLRTAVFGDGLLAAPGGTMPPTMQLDGDRFDDNARFGAYFIGATVGIGASTTATGNGSGPGGHDMDTMFVTGAGFVPQNPNLPPGTDLARATDTLGELTFP